MNIVSRVQQKIKSFDFSWMIPTGFGISCALLTAGIVMLMIRGFGNMENGWIFSIGADLFCLAISVMLSFSCVLNYKSRNEHTRVFVILLTVSAFSLFLDETTWLFQGIAPLRGINHVVYVLHYVIGVVLVYLFWQYIRRVLKMENSLMETADGILNLLLIPSLLLCAVNFFYPLYFTIDENGFCSRTDKWYISQVYLCFALLIVILELLMSQASKRDRMVAISFIAIPLVNQLLTSFTTSITTQYAAMLVAIVLIYGVLFADREKKISTTETELGVAKRIQADMLPNEFPFLPERGEFDLYASMNPAKEVGGDFYDFFFVDEDHLALVIADVSGKGIPAAMFMMMAKNMLQTQAMTGRSPQEVLNTVNQLICKNNQEKMFVTVWFGILDLVNGILTAANAGHEYPMLKQPDSPFELIKDKHGFVLGGIDRVRYKEYELHLEPGSKVFVYTDGVSEAQNSGKELFGRDRIIQALNTAMDEAPEGILQAVDKAVSDFVGEEEQFDDLTMLCIEYRGRAEETQRS